MLTSILIFLLLVIGIVFAVSSTLSNNKKRRREHPTHFRHRNKRKKYLTYDHQNDNKNHQAWGDDGGDSGGD
ncbi:hypothetical protein U8V72_17450 [Priestia filamentosa]|uniref:hypothetical protein n=1 Tax=Priestia filamentosa TaxID=1402861 RepID=UPI0005896CC8